MTNTQHRWKIVYAHTDETVIWAGQKMHFVRKVAAENFIDFINQDFFEDMEVVRK